MNMRTKQSGKDTIHVALPTDLQRPIKGGCSCGYCAAHPDRMPMWDTLAIPRNGEGYSYSVHFPDLFK